MLKDVTSSMGSRAAGRPGTALGDVLATAAGDSHRVDPVAPGTGGPAGNARLTAWVGLVVLVFFLAETATLISVGHFITAHILIGTFLVPLVLLKTATTGWRILRYYQGDPAYRQAGPPPLLLRILGPLVILTGLAVLGSGLALVPLGQSSYQNLTTLLGFGISALTIHKVSFVVWLAATGLHVLARTVPALQVASGSGPHHRAVPGKTTRAATLLVTVVVSVAVALVITHLAGDWTHHRFVHLHKRFGNHGLSVS
jgi:hypothetical protein